MTVPDAPTVRRRRLLNGVAVAATGGAVLLAGVGLAHPGDGDAVAVDVEPAAAAVPPETVAPFALGSETDGPSSVDGTRLGTDAPERSPVRRGPERRAPTGDAAEGTGPGARASTDAMTPTPPPTRPARRPSSDPARPAGDPGRDLRGLLGPRYSAIPEPPPRRSPPVGLEISSIDVGDAPIRAVGLRDDLQLEIPPETEIGWYRFGATAGEAGSTVLVAHVAWNDIPGPFAELGTVEPGDVAEIRLEDGRARRYEVVERTVHGKLALPRDVIWRRSGPEMLVMITCGGELQPDSRRYAENIVVYALPVG